MSVDSSSEISLPKTHQQTLSNSLTLVIHQFTSVLKASSSKIQMLLLSVISLGKFLGRASLATPCATTIQTGAAVAWWTFTHGVYEGVTDIFVHTYRSKRERGALGIANGLTMGLIAYPSQGVYRGLRKGFRKG